MSDWSGLGELPEEIRDYVQGILAVGEFRDGVELQAEIGELLAEVGVEWGEVEIREICDKLVGNKNDNGAISAVRDGVAGMGFTERTEVFLTVEDSDDKIVKDTEEAVQKDWRKVDIGKKEKQVGKKKKVKDKKKDGKVMNNKYHSEEVTVSQGVWFIEREERQRERDIHLVNFYICYGDRVLIRDTNLMIGRNRRYGLVGRNGTGKTTLVSLLAERKLRLPSWVTVLHVAQEAAGGKENALEAVLESDAVRAQLVAEVARLEGQESEEGSEELGELYEELEWREADRDPARAARILTGLGFSSAMQAGPTDQLSGGWRMRLALAAALFCQPHLLLLDEPTNMLDLAAVVWLERELAAWHGTLIVISHDHDFLDNVATDILHLHSQTIHTFRGNYSDYLYAKTLEQREQITKHQAGMRKLKHVQQTIAKNRGTGGNIAVVKSRLKLVEKMTGVIRRTAQREGGFVYHGPETVIAPPCPDPPPVFKFPVIEPLDGTVLSLEGVEFSYEGRGSEVFLRTGDLGLSMECRVGVVGGNGQGKTTLLRLLLGDLTPDRGTREAHRHLRLGHFTQHFVDQLDLSVCAVELLVRELDMRADAARAQLGRFGISGNGALQQISTLSGGEKARVALAVICGREPNFLVLDEPSNHLDIESLAALGEGLCAYRGGLVLVSHDQRLVGQVCDTLWEVAGGRVHTLTGGLAQYKDSVLDTRE